MLKMGEDSSDLPDLTEVQAKGDLNCKRSCKLAPLKNGNWGPLNNSWDTHQLYTCKDGERLTELEALSAAGCRVVHTCGPGRNSDGSAIQHL